jgi:hypothetical protein
MSELKYKVGDKAGPFEITDLDYDDSELPYRLQCKNEAFWISEKDADSIFDHYAKSELLEKKAESQRKTIAYWKKKSNNWEKSYFGFQGKMSAEIDAIGQDLDSALSSLKEAKTHLKWSQESNCEFLERCRLAESKIEALESDAKKNRIEIELLKADHASIWDEYNTLDQSRKHSTVLAWIGWIFFFISIFGMIFLRP